MQNIVYLKDYRKKTRKAYLLKHGSRLNRFVEKFVRTHIDVDFLQLADDYQQDRYNRAEEAWDYMHFREILAEALDEAFGAQLYRLLIAEYWFDAKLITKDEVIERCLSDYIMNRCQYATQI